MCQHIKQIWVELFSPVCCYHKTVLIGRCACMSETSHTEAVRSEKLARHTIDSHLSVRPASFTLWMFAAKRHIYKSSSRKRPSDITEINIQQTETNAVILCSLILFASALPVSNSQSLWRENIGHTWGCCSLEAAISQDSIHIISLCQLEKRESNNKEMDKMFDRDQAFEPDLGGEEQCWPKEWQDPIALGPSPSGPHSSYRHGKKSTYGATHTVHS